MASSASTKKKKRESLEVNSLTWVTLLISPNGFYNANANEFDYDYSKAEYNSLRLCEFCSENTG